MRVALSVYPEVQENRRSTPDLPPVIQCRRKVGATEWEVAMVDVYTVPISKAQFRKLPKEERALVLVSGHMLNQISVLWKLVRFSTNRDRQVPIEGRVSAAQSQIILRCLLGTLAEGCVYFSEKVASSKDIFQICIRMGRMPSIK